MFNQGVDFDLFESFPNNGTSICLYSMILVKKIPTPNNL